MKTHSSWKMYCYETSSSQKVLYNGQNLKSMYGKCNTCRGMHFILDRREANINLNEAIKWTQWSTKKEKGMDKSALHTYIHKAHTTKN